MATKLQGESRLQIGTVSVVFAQNDNSTLEKRVIMISVQLPVLF